MISQIIKKGKHYCNSWWWPPYFCFGYKLKGAFAFKGNFSYNSNGDTNKLIGLSDGFKHHKNSIRIGWRYDAKTDKVELSAITYVNGNRQIDQLFKVNTYTKIDFEITIKKDRYELIINESYCIFNRVSKWFLPRLILKPYFGGKNKAPKDFEIVVRLQ